MRVGIFDSGLGGLTVLRALRREVPADYFYLGDTARTPYGTKSPATIIRYARESAAFLLRQEVDVLVVACNTASALALQVLEDECPCPVVGTIEPAVSTCLAQVETGLVGVIGTNATVRSAVYEQELRSRAPQLQVLSIACPLFVPLVEEGLCSGPLVDQAIELYLAPLLTQRAQALILACTHYPLLAGALSAYLGPAVRIIDCASAVATRVKTLLNAKGFDPQAGAGESTECYFVTDEVSRFNALATQFLDSSAVKAVRLEGLTER